MNEKTLVAQKRLSWIAIAVLLGTAAFMLYRMAQPLFGRSINVADTIGNREIVVILLAIGAWFFTVMPLKKDGAIKSKAYMAGLLWILFGATFQFFYQHSLFFIPHNIGAAMFIIAYPIPREA